MENTPEIGKIYDTLFFCIRYFNESAVERIILSKVADSSFMEECYREVQEKIPSLPPLLAPMFLNKDSIPTAMSEFFTYQVDFASETMESFLKKIASKSDVLYAKILDSVFPANQKTENKMIAPQISPAAYVEALAEAPYADDFKLQISLVLGNFPYAVSILIETLREISLQIDALHQKYAPQLAEKWRQVQSKQSKELFRQFYELDLSANWDSMLVSLSLLNQYILLQTVKNGRIGLLLGFCYAEELSHTIDERKLDLRQILIALGNDIRLSILQTLLEKGELTVSTLSKLLKIPGTTVLRHTEVLYSCGILFISRRQGLQLFYKVNLLLLSQAVKAAEGRLSKFLPEGNSEGNGGF